MYIPGRYLVQIPDAAFLHIMEDRRCAEPVLIRSLHLRKNESEYRSPERMVPTLSGVSTFSAHHPLLFTRLSMPATEYIC